MSKFTHFGTLVGAVTGQAREDPGRPSVVFEQSGESSTLTRVDIVARMHERATALRALGVKRGDRVAVMLPTSADFVGAVLGLMSIGAVPCPVAPPSAFGLSGQYVERLRDLACYLGARYAIAPERFAQAIEAPLEQVQVLTPPLIDEHATGGAPVDRLPAPAEIALIQSTSGSTAAPKGVVLTHENLLANVHQIGAWVGGSRDDVVVCWLPMYHDMGFIGCLVFALYWGMKLVLSSPFTFMRRPGTWLDLISRHRGTLSPAPNFAYRTVTERVREKDLDSFDLSSWRVAFCGAEPINPRTLLQFEERLRPAGLQPGIIMPCFGLAEATLAVTLHPPSTRLLWDRVDRDALARHQISEVPTNDPAGVDVADCGPPVPGSRVRIVDENWDDLPDRRVGRILISGPGVMRGYFGMPDETSEAMRDGWLDTGDLGYLVAGSLRVTGRKKDLIIIRGQNYLPHDFEDLAGQVQGVKPGKVAAFGIAGEGGTEQLCLVCEADVSGDDALAELQEAIVARIMRHTGVYPGLVRFVPKNWILRTTSGKLRRNHMRRLLLESDQSAAD